MPALQLCWFDYESNVKKSNKYLKQNWWLHYMHYRVAIFRLWTLGLTKLLEYTEFMKSIHLNIKFTLVNYLDLTLNSVEGCFFIAQSLTIVFIYILRVHIQAQGNVLRPSYNQWNLETKPKLDKMRVFQLSLTTILY